LRRFGTEGRALDWRLWVGLCKSKGYKLEALEAELQDRPGYSRQTLSKLSKRKDPADPELVALAWRLEVRNGCEDDFELYWRGLASLGVEVPPVLAATLSSPPPPRVDWTPKLDAIVSTLADKLDAAASALGDKLDALAASVRGRLDAFILAARAMLDSTSAKLDGVSAKLDGVSAKLDGVSAKLDGVSGKLDHVGTEVTAVAAAVARVAATVNDVDAKGDLAAYQQARDTRRILHSLWGMGGLVSLVVIVVVRCQPGLTPPSLVNVNAGTEPHEATRQSASEGSGGRDRGVRFRAGGINLGERKSGRPMPRTRLRWDGQDQAVAPCEGSETELYRLCWKATAHSPPCPSDEFQEGKKCYIPMFEPLKPPASETHAPPDLEQR
jgi:hypothetical protein